jgi:hypothetical protein
MGGYIHFKVYPMKSIVFFTFLFFFSANFFGQENLNDQDLILKIDSFMTQQGFTKTAPKLGTIESRYYFTLDAVKDVLIKQFSIVDARILDDLIYFPDPNYITEFGHSIMNPNRNTLNLIIDKISEFSSQIDCYNVNCYGNKLIRDKIMILRGVILRLVKVGLDKGNDEKFVRCFSGFGLYGGSLLFGGIGHASKAKISEIDKEKLSTEVQSFMYDQGFTNEFPSIDAVEYKYGFVLSDKYIPDYYLIRDSKIKCGACDQGTYFPIQNYTTPEGYSLLNPNQETCKYIISTLYECLDKKSLNSDCQKYEIRNKFIALNCKDELSLKEFSKLMENPQIDLGYLEWRKGQVKYSKIAYETASKSDTTQKKQISSKVNISKIDTTFNYPNNESELLKKYYSFEDKWTGIEYLKYVIKNTTATDTNSILIFAYAHLFKIIDQSVYFYKSTLISQEEWNSNYEMLSMFPANLIQKGEGKRAFYLFAFIVCGQKTNNNTIQYWKAILEEFNSENCPLGAEFYAQCKKVTDEYSNNLKLAEEKQAKVNSDNLLKSQLFNYFSQGVTNGIKEAKQNLDEVLNGDGCYQCFTSGNCKKCTKGQYQVFFKNNQQCSEYNSTAYKVGYIICTKCRGSEYILSSCNGCGNDKCRGELCDNKLCTEGWTKCLDCNSNNSNSQIGKCSSCKGTGKTH